MHFIEPAYEVANMPIISASTAVRDYAMLHMEPRSKPGSRRVEPDVPL